MKTTSIEEDFVITIDQEKHQGIIATNYTSCSGTTALRMEIIAC